MALVSCTRLGPYEVVAPLGAGGMGEVYKAKDTRLERTVAIKVLPQRLSASPETRQRFEREARTISQLSHPHICALYDVGREGETEYLVMEYLEGETLSERLAKGPLPLEQTLRYGQEIADALDKAHRQGIVHRDLKPGNVMLTKSGVKLLDFGLAKAMAPPPSQSSLTALPTQQGLTQEGTILGTFQYMAPEQLEGKEADARTDIFGFGATLYEMATGRKAFSGTTQASLIGAILHTEPQPISAIEPMAPPALDRVVKTCLAKDPEDRWQSAGDVGKELKWIAEGSAAGIAAPAVVVSRRRTREGIAWAGFAIAGVSAAILGAALLRSAARARDARPVRAFITVPEKSAFRFLFAGGPPALSPDGRKLVFAAESSDGKRLLWLRPLESLVAQPLVGTEGAMYPFWSPDSRFVGFFAETKVKKIDATGGPPITLCEVSEGGRGGSWNRDNTIIFAGRYTPVYQVSAAGGSPVVVTRFDPARKDTTHRWPLFLPDGSRFLYLASKIGSESESNAIFLASLDGKENRLLFHASSNVAYASGHLLFVRERMLIAQPFDARLGRLRGEPFPIAEQLQYDPIFSRGVFSVSDNGVLAYQTGLGLAAGAELVWFDRAGKSLGSLGEPLPYLGPRLSPDGERVAVSIFDPRAGTASIWIYDIERAIKTRLTFGLELDRAPTWSRDGRRIAFARRRTDGSQIFVKNSDGSGTEETLLQSSADDVPADWSADGQFIAFGRAGRPGGREDIWILPLSGDRKPFPFLQSEFNETSAHFSPDGKWLAYASDESGRFEIYVVPFPGPGGKFQISSSGGIDPSWRRDGREIFCVALDRKLMAVGVETGPAFRVGTAQALFPTRPRAIGGVYDVSSDGQKFLVAKLTSEEASQPIALVLNWTAELRK
jgi:eukaryotic-like serine/threonine-protein kinase